MGKYYNGYKKYKVDTISQLKRVLGDIAQEKAQQIQEEALQIAKDVLVEEIYSQPTSEYYDRTEELLDTPMIFNKWKNAYGQGFSLGYDTTILSTRYKYRVQDGGKWKTMLGQHMGVEGEDVRENVMNWLDEGFTIIGSERFYEGTHFTQIARERIRQRIQQIINS